jgi:predicted ABC-type ATPase
LESFFQVFCSFLLVFNNQENGGKQMQPKLIILRGNSGSGKTTIAKALHQCLKEQSLLISQDVVRREMLRVKDETGNLSIALLKQLVAFGYQECQYVIVEGIFSKSHLSFLFSGNESSL